MGLKIADAYPAGGVDSRSNPIVMPMDRYLLVRDFWPREDGSFQLRDGYSFLTAGLQPGVPIHSIVGVTGSAPDRDPLIVFWQGTTPYVFNPRQATVTAIGVRGVPIQSASRFCYFYVNGHLHAFNGTDAKWFDGFLWRDIGLPLPPELLLAELQVIESVREFSAAEAAAVTLTLASGGSFPADVTGRVFYCAFYDLDFQEIGPATIPIGPSSGFVKFALNQQLQVAGLPNVSALHSRWKKLPALTGDGNQKARFAVTSTKQIASGAVVPQSYALTTSAASNNPTAFPTPSFSAALSAPDLSAGPATAMVSGSEQSAPDTSLAQSLTVLITGQEDSIQVMRGQFIDHTVYDHGRITLTLNGADGFSQFYWVFYGAGSTPANLAAAIALRINADTAARFTATASGGSVLIVPTVSGGGTVYTATITSLTTDPTNFGVGSTSFPTSLSSAQFGQRTVFDSGTVTVSVNGRAARAAYGANDDSDSVALALSTAINALNAGVQASVSGSVVTISESNTSVQVQLTVPSNGFSVDDVVGVSNTGDSAYDGHLFTVLAVSTNTVTLNVPNASVAVTQGTVQKLAAVSAAGTTINITAPVFFTPYWVNADRGIAASEIGGKQPGYLFYVSLWMKDAGGHVGNRAPIGVRLAPTVRTNVRIVGPVPLTDSEQVLLLGRTSDGAEIPYVIVDLNANWVSWTGVGPSFLIDQSEIDGSSELPSRNFPPPGTLDYNVQLEALNNKFNLPDNGLVTSTFSRAWVESDHCCGAIEGSPTLYRSGSALDMREGKFVGLPEQSWAPIDIETFPTAQPITCGQGYQQESWVYTKHDCGALMELAGETQWQGPWNIGCAGQYAWTKGWKNLPYWVTGKKQLATLSPEGPIVISEEYEGALLSQIADEHLADVEVNYIRHPRKKVEVLRIKCQDRNCFPFTIIHDFRLRDQRSPFGQGYLEVLGGPLTGWFTPGITLTRSNGVVTAVFAADPGIVVNQVLSLKQWDDVSFDGYVTVTSVIIAGNGTTTITWLQPNKSDGSSSGGQISIGPVAGS